MNVARSATLVIALALAACVKPASQSVTAPTSGGSAALDALAADFWSELVRRSPLWATAAGDRERDAELDDPTTKEARRHVEALLSLRRRLEAVDVKGLGNAGQVTAEALREHLTSRIDAENACQPHLWQVDPLGGPQVKLAQLPIHHSIRTKADLENLLARYRGAAAFLAAHVATLREGLAGGWSAPRPVVERLVTQLDAQLAQSAAESPHADVTLPAEWNAEEAARARKALVSAVETGVRPGLAAYRDFLRNELLPTARTAPGADKLPGGDACYRAMIRLETGTTRSAREIHDIGVAQVAKIESEMLAIAKAAGAADIASYVAALDAKPGVNYSTREEIVAHNREFIDKARAALPKVFRVQPTTPVEVRPIEAFREKDASRGQYQHAPPDGSRPGIYFVNTLDPQTLRRYATAALAAHEALPGHHMQIALAQETKGLPRFQRDLPPTVYVEGWGLYSERLADELGLYSGDAERFGMLEGQRIRAVRLVADTGLHGLGWSRDQAVEYAVAHGVITRKQAERAIDRYITWPGQALAYMMGQLELQEMRAAAEKSRGAAFDVREFHDRVLRHGGVPLPVVRREIDAWIR